VDAVSHAYDLFHVVHDREVSGFPVLSVFDFLYLFS
jgi:hypothetical protein